MRTQNDLEKGCENGRRNEKSLEYLLSKSIETAEDVSQLAARDAATALPLG